MASGVLLSSASAEKTEQFANQAIEKGLAVKDHYRVAHDGLVLSSLGMGSYLGEPTEEDDQKLHDALVTSVTEYGLNVIDTAINYRYQKAERAIGQALQTLQTKHGISRESLFVASKNGFITPDADINEDFRTWFGKEFIESGILDPADIAGGMHCISPGYLEHQLNRSLSNLQLETLDLMYLHNAAESQIPVVGKEVFMSRLAKAFEFYESAIKAGKLRYYGMATWDCFRVEAGDPVYLSLAEVLQLAEKVGGTNHGFRFIQLPFNLLMVQALAVNNQPVFEGQTSLLQAAQAFGIGVFTSVPLLQGQLLKEKLPHVEGCESNAQLCLQLVRSMPGIIAPLIGQKQMSHVQDNMAISKINPLPFEALQETLQVLV